MTKRDDDKLDKEYQSDWLTNIDLDYHLRQFSAPYRSTVAFCDWLETIDVITSNGQGRLVDVGAGGGANVKYMGDRFGKYAYLGVDLNPQLVELGNAYFSEQGLPHQLIEGDLFNLSSVVEGVVEGVISFQTLSWLSDYQPALCAMAGLGARWIAASSLFYQGPIDCRVEVVEFLANRHRKAFYNIYSLNRVKALFAQLGYPEFHSIPFVIDVDLEPPVNGGLGTYTRRLENGERLQFSGPLAMPWHFMVACRTLE